MKKSKLRKLTIILEDMPVRIFLLIFQKENYKEICTMIIFFMIYPLNICNLIVFKRIKHKLSIFLFCIAFLFAY